MATNYEVAHAWANKLDKCNYGSSMQHDYGKVYSYHTCIGEIANFGEEEVYILNDTTYSSSSSKHQRYVIDAIPNASKVFYIEGIPMGTGALLDRDLIGFGLHYMVSEIKKCKEIKTSKSLKCDLEYDGYVTMKQWLSITKCTTIPKIIKMSDEEIWQHMRYYIDSIKTAKEIKKMVKLMHANTPIQEIVDAIDGKGTWEEYQKRIVGTKQAARNREMAKYLKFNTPGYNYHDIYGKYTSVVQGSITNKIRLQHIKDGDWIKFLLNTKRANIQEAIKQGDKNTKKYSREKSKLNLEIYCGLKGFSSYKRAISSFDYNGTVVSFPSKWWIKERTISNDEYEEYINLSKEEQKSWRIAKKDWMLSNIQHDEIEHEQWEKRNEEERKRAAAEKEAEEKRERDNADYIAKLKNSGDDGIKQLWHEGYKVSVFGKSSSFFEGGNVLLRVKNDIVETSKGIKIPKNECQRLWKFVQRWHNNGTTFISGEQVHATMSDFEISRYQSDIMIAGCHAIAYNEMKMVATKLGLIA